MVALNQIREKLEPFLEHPAVGQLTTKWTEDISEGKGDWKIYEVDEQSIHRHVPTGKDYPQERRDWTLVKNLGALAALPVYATTSAVTHFAHKDVVKSILFGLTAIQLSPFTPSLNGISLNPLSDYLFPFFTGQHCVTDFLSPWITTAIAAVPLFYAIYDPLGFRVQLDKGETFLNEKTKPLNEKEISKLTVPKWIKAAATGQIRLGQIFRLSPIEKPAPKVDESQKEQKEEQVDSVPRSVAEEKEVHSDSD